LNIENFILRFKKKVSRPANPNLYETGQKFQPAFSMLGEQAQPAFSWPSAGQA